MNRKPLALCLLLACSLPALAACSDDPAGGAARQAEAAGEPDTTAVFGIEIEKVAREVRDEMATENIEFGSRRDGEAGGEAEITPRGDLIVDGKPVEVDAAQRALLLDYRGHVEEVAVAGARIGLQGADLATSAMGEAFRGVFGGGDEAAMEARIESEAGKIKAEVATLCAHLQPMLDTQQALVASIPELAPYASMTQDDVDECHEDGTVNIP